MKYYIYVNHRKYLSKSMTDELTSYVNLYKKTIIISTTDIQQIRNKYCI